ncbi:PREDICTED: protein NDR1-like [Erythranthe guttata]|uniref:protein NDR1-like n=1 Tax=Erythranthe guttata TaxID=4155 RepID=UPI00064DCE45|nr:PREDICTED: protein NDR1-like [Erythranthe guttata]|eukprot:XP_012852391.1 PREDICTED: protein NDR1-like [Erythranthe guttata]
MDSERGVEGISTRGAIRPTRVTGVAGPSCRDADASAVVKRASKPSSLVDIGTMNLERLKSEKRDNLAFVNIEYGHIVRYGDVNLTFSYGRNNNAVANYVVWSFDQGWWEVDYRWEVVESRGVPWEDAVKAVSNGSTVVFRVDLAARLKFWEGMWYSKKKGVRIGADVEVDGTGLKVKKKDIRLNSAASQRRVGIYVLFMSLLDAWKCLCF